MSTPLQPVVALLVSAAVLLMGNGLLSVLLPVRAGLDAFSQLDIGIMGSAYFLGLVIGCLVSPGIIARVGHIRAFAAFAAVATVTPLCHAIFPLPPVWWLLRALTGLCFAGLFMGIESWLNAASDRENRGRVLAAYTMLNLTVTTVGMQLSGLFPARGFELFSLVAVLYSLAAVPVSLTRTVAPTPPRRSRLRLVWLIGVSPAAVLACLFTGMVNGAFWTLGPTYAHAAGLGFEEVALFLSAAVLGGALAQWPVGLSSDRLGRRPVAALVSAAAALAGLGLVVAAGSQGSRPVLYATAAAFGAMAFPIYALAVAHANDLVHRKRAVEVSSGLLLTFSVGAVVGPLAAAALMQWGGATMLFLLTAVAHGLIVLVMLVRAAQRPALPTARQEDYVAVPRTTPAVFELDPRAAPPEAATTPPEAAR